MKLCVPIPCFFPNIDFCDALRKVAKLGYDTVEIYGWSNLNAEKVKEVLSETGVKLLSICTSNFLLTDPDNRENWLENLDKSCAFAKSVGATHLITQVGKDMGTAREVQHQSIVDGLKAARPILEKWDMILMPEPLNILVDHPGYYLTRSDEAFQILDEVDSPHVKLVFDIYHQQITEGNIIPNVLNHLPQIAHLHSAGHPGRIELQYGENDYKFIFSAIDKAGYTGYCGLEYHPTLAPEESLRRAKEIYG